jgi:hypothetical protein
LLEEGERYRVPAAAASEGELVAERSAYLVGEKRDGNG